MAVKRSSGSRRKKGGGSSGWFQGHSPAVMFFRLLTALALLFFSRILFYLFNLGYFSSIGFVDLMKLFAAGLRFDISALMFLNAPYILMNLLPFRFREGRVYQGIATGYFFVINSLALFANFVDTIYFRFTLKRLTADIFGYMDVGGDFDKLIPQFLHDFWYIALVWVASVALLVWLGTRFKTVAGGGKASGGFSFYSLNTLILAIAGAIAVVGMRGGLQLRPINMVTAGQYTSAKNLPLVLNTPFSILKTFGDQSLKTIRLYKSEQELAQVYTPVHPAGPGPFRDMNVMIIMMESMSREHIGALNHSLDNGRYQGFTPFLDSLLKHSLYFDAFANGKTSIQGIPSILSSVPSLMNESFIQSSYAAGKYTSIAGILKGKGYTTAFFHGGTNGTMGFDSYSRLVGFDHYFGRTEYANEADYDGKWGIRDEEFLQYTAKTMNGLKQPFAAALFTLSSHHPYYVPMKFVNVFRKGKLPIQQSVMYADYALGRFFETAKRMPWYRNTLFVITADHTSEGYYPYYQSDVGQYAIPLIFYRPGDQLTGTPKVVAQQTDILPSVLGYLGYDRSFVAFGNNLFDSLAGAPRFSVHFITGLYGLMMDGFYMENDGTKSTALFDLSADPLQKNNIVGNRPEVRKRMERFLYAYLQQYNNRLIENRMFVDETPRPGEASKK